MLVGGQVRLKRPPDSVLGGVAVCVGWNEGWKAEPWAQWESNQERGFLWIGSRPKRWRGPLCFLPEMKRQHGKPWCVTAISLGQLAPSESSAHLYVLVCFTRMSGAPEKCMMAANS